MSIDDRDPVSELAKGMEAAEALIASLEDEVANLRRDLEQASTALKAAREEVSARERALEGADGARNRAEEEATRLRAELSGLKNRHADEQLRLRNEHITELAEVRRKLEEQRRSDVQAASTEERFEALREEHRIEREALEERRRSEVEALKTSAERWEEKLREEYREQEERHRSEMETVLRRAEEEKAELQGSFTRNLEETLSREMRGSEERHEAALQALRSAAAGREIELQRDYQAVVETQQAEIESLREELETRSRNEAARHRKELREVKVLAEDRERELRDTHAARLSEANEDAERRVATLRAQREADNRALLARHAEEISRLRREYEERLVAEDERRKSETWALEERLAEARVRRETETRAYNARLTELEAARLAQRSSAQEDVARVVERFGAEISALEDRIAELQDALSEAHAARAGIPAEAVEQEPSAAHDGGMIEDGQARTASENLVDELDARRILAEERAADLEERLRAAREEGRRDASELEEARVKLRSLADPGRRLREGIDLFNASEHARTVASISKAFGLPRVHAGTDVGDLTKPVITFAWEGVEWRRYVADPTDGVEEPRVYLVGTGDDPGEAIETERPNARMDAQGRLTLGVQAR